MDQRTSLPMTISRVMLTVGIVLAVIAITVALAFAVIMSWSNPWSLNAANEMESTLAALQPWLSLSLVGAGVILMLAVQIMERLLKLLSSVSAGQAFSIDNTGHLRRIGVLLLVMEAVGLVVGLIGSRLPADSNLTTNFDVSFGGLLAAMLAFVLAELFEQARVMRDELEGTI